MSVPLGWGPLGFTSGRRTYAGNRKVGGVANSDHLHGTAADFTASESQLRKFFGPNVRILNENDHRHVSGLTDVPYYGRNGTYGLVNGVDTSAPKGQPPVRRPDPITRSLTNNAPLNDVPLFGQTPDQMGSQMAAMTPTQGPAMPEQFERKPGAFGRGGIGWAILGSLGDALSAYGGQKGVFAPAMQDFANRQAEENRFREQLNAQMQMAQYRASLPGKPTQTDRYLAEILDPNTDPKRKALLRQVVGRPIGVPVYGADGAVTTQFYYPDQMPGMSAGGDDDWEDY